jgi:hypothetical protein
MKKVIITLLCIITLAQCGEKTPTLSQPVPHQSEIAQLQKKIDRTKVKLHDARKQSYWHFAFTFLAGSSVRFPRYIAIPGALFCGLSIFKPDFLSNIHQRLGLGDQAKQFGSNFWKIAQTSVSLLVKKTGEFADRLEARNKTSETNAPKQKESSDQ